MLRHLIERQAYLQNKIEELQTKLSSYPKEHLAIVNNGKYCKYYKSDGHISYYIPKKEKSLAVELAHKKLDACLLEESRSELKMLASFLAKYQLLHTKSEQLLNDAAFRSLFQIPPDNVHSEILRQWSEEEYDRNPLHPELLIHKCFSGESVRSKSEVIIANTLFTNHVPYRYECALALGDKILYPDFTIMHPETLKIIYWEHFGMMDVPSYCDHAFNKLKLYSQHNILPDINLITTYENLEYPIDSVKIQKLVLNLLKS